MKKTPLRRRKPMPRAGARKPVAARSGTPKPRKALPKTNPVRRAKNLLRAYGPKERREWISRQPCILGGAGPIDPVHVKTGGTGYKADAKWVVPLTHSYHEELHQHGQSTFEAKYGIDLHWWAQVIDARWEAHVAITQQEDTP